MTSPPRPVLSLFVVVVLLSVVVAAVATMTMVEEDARAAHAARHRRLASSSPSTRSSSPLSPPLPPTTTPTPTPFGHAMYEHFLLDRPPAWTNYNHGSFGACPRRVLAYQSTLREQCESEPNLWFRGGYQQLLLEARAAVAAMINASSIDSLVLTDNASSGVNSVLRSLRLGVDDEVVLLSVAYPMVKNTVDFLRSRFGVHVGVVNLTFPLASPDDVVTALDDYLRAARARNDERRARGETQRRLALCSFSHIVSLPAVTLPVARLAELCDAHGAAVLVDGAHALGNIVVDVGALGPISFYAGNGHKWLYSAKGSAMLWVADAWRARVEPLIISSEESAEFAGNFAWQGTRDVTTWLTMAEALRWRADVAGGDAAIMTYQHTTALAAGTLLAERWHTRLLAPPSMINSMVDVVLPIPTDAAGARVFSRLRASLIDAAGAYVQPYALLDSVGYCVRVSVPVYIELSDIERLADDVLGVVTRELANNNNNNNNNNAAADDDDDDVRHHLVSDHIVEDL